jgi:hypothetical protein
MYKGPRDPFNSIFISLSQQRRDIEGIGAGKATQTKEISRPIIHRPPQVRCAYVIGDRSAPLQKREIREKKKAQVENSEIP